MKVKKIMCCCGGGMGSSLLIRMNVEKILNNWNIHDVEVTHSSLSDAVEGNADLFVVGGDLESFVHNLSNVITLKNIMSMSELESCLKDYFK